MADYINTRPDVPAERRRRDMGQNVGARLTNVVLGAWLFISSFIWIHSAASQTNSWITGVLIAAFGLLAMAVPKVRYLNTAAAVWLFLSSVFFIPHLYLATAWHNAILAIVVFAISLVPADRRLGTRKEGRGRHSAIGDPRIRV